VKERPHLVALYVAVVVVAALAYPLAGIVLACLGLGWSLRGIHDVLRRG
jgi:thiol:disulfide interchange protein